MKNVTVSLDDDTYRRARMIAAERETSISALVKRFLIELGSGESEAERLKKEERALREKITEFRASDRLSRDDLYRRDPWAVPFFLDTNILLYSISCDPKESAKRKRAIALLERDDCALSVQVLQEFYAQATREKRADRIPHDIACDLVRTWTRFRVQDMTVPILTQALAIRAESNYSYWDCAIIAAAKALGCRQVYSEDMAHGREVGGVQVFNPFLETA
jgi:predicted nucleic acid-binding protein